MPLDPTVLADLSGVSKRVYSRYFEDVFPYMTPLLAQVKRMNPKRLRFGGDAVFFSLRTDRRGGFVTSGGTLPNGGNAKTVQGQLGITRSYIKQELDGLALAATEASEAAFESLAKKSLDESFYEIQLNLNRILHGDSRGVRAVITTVTDNNSLIVNHAYGITGAGPGAAHLAPGEQVVVRDASAAFAVLGRAVIASVTPNADGTANVEFVGAGFAGMAAGDVLVAATDTEDSYGLEANGLMSILDPNNTLTSFEGITVADHPRFKAQKMAATGGLIDEVEIMKLLYTIKSKGGVDPSMNPDEFLQICSSGILVQYADTLLGERRFERTYELKGGWKAMEVAGLPLIDDPDMPRGMFDVVHVPSLTWVDLRDFGKLKYGDSTAWVQSQGRDAFECTLRSYWNFGCIVRNTHGCLTGITDTMDFSRVQV
jgi:rhodanese-related sulfurtransferase